VSLSRREFLATSPLAVAAAGLARPRPSWAGAGQAPAPPPVTKFTDLRRGVGVFTGNGGHIGYLVNAAGAVAVDSQFPDTAKIAVDGLKQRAPTGIEMLLNTHHHGDHTGGNQVFRGTVKRIVAQERCIANHRRVAREAGTEAQQSFADVGFGESWSANFGDEKVWGHYYGPGHTGGDAVYTFEKANVVHGGDLLFYRAHPNIDLVAGASAVNWIRVLEKITKAHADDTIYIFGHGTQGRTTGSKADVLYFRDYLSAAVDHARKGLAAGKSKEEIQALDALKGFEDVQPLSQRLSLAFVLGICVDELTKK
jgi:cyclase